MFYLYILRNSQTDRYYIGSTNNLKRRLKEHVSGKTRTTKILKTYELVYTEEYKVESEARNREKKLKSYKSKKYIRWLITRKSMRP
ncbi:GIY-YIG nuclease family protein [Candidatus Microgenomates bacterium]|nr:MAG: GIY-YIG nuclease family protein [Candidatus Microgenomates bacterium]